MDKKFLVKQKGVIINNDIDEYERYIKERNRLKAIKNETENTRERLAILEKGVAEIKSLLVKIMKN